MYTFTDIDECALGVDACSDDATCTDIEGSYVCTCHPGYTGNGVNCTGMSCMDNLITLCGASCIMPSIRTYLNNKK